MGLSGAWQWLGLAAAVVLAALAAAALRGVMRASPPRGRSAIPGACWPCPPGLAAAALILDTAVSRLGVTQAGLQAVGTAAAVSLVLALAWLAFAFIGAVGGWFAARAQQTISYRGRDRDLARHGPREADRRGDGVVWTADLIGLPYEGVLTALGAGGVAIAFAARDTVSNMMGGGILMADRPFTRGDLIELDGKLATVEQVGLRSTRLRALDDTVLNVPNAQLSDRVIANWGAGGGASRPSP
jgi:MscS family membrane protein